MTPLKCPSVFARTKSHQSWKLPDNGMRGARRHRDVPYRELKSSFCSRNGGYGSSSTTEVALLDPFHLYTSLYLDRFGHTLEQWYRCFQHNESDGFTFTPWEGRYGKQSMSSSRPATVSWRKRHYATVYILCLIAETSSGTRMII